MRKGKIKKTPWDVYYETLKESVNFISPERPPTTRAEMLEFKGIVRERCAQLCSSLVSWYWNDFENEWINEIKEKYAALPELNDQVRRVSSLGIIPKLRMLNLWSCSNIYRSRPGKKYDYAQDSRMGVEHVSKLLKLRGITMSEFVFGESFPCPITSLEYALITKIKKLPPRLSIKLKSQLALCKSQLITDIESNPSMRKKIAEEECFEIWIDKGSPTLPHDTTIYDYTSTQMQDYDTPAGTQRVEDCTNQYLRSADRCLSAVLGMQTYIQSPRDYLRSTPAMFVIVLMSLYSGIPLECFYSENPQPACDQYYYHDRHTDETLFLGDREKEWLKLLFRIGYEQKMNLLIALSTDPDEIDFRKIIFS